jgi:hypothetical protein
MNNNLKNKIMEKVSVILIYIIIISCFSLVCVINLIVISKLGELFIKYFHPIFDYRYEWWWSIIPAIRLLTS